MTEATRCSRHTADGSQCKKNATSQGPDGEPICGIHARHDAVHVDQAPPEPQVDDGHTIDVGPVAVGDGITMLDPRQAVTEDELDRQLSNPDWLNPSAAGEADTVNRADFQHTLTPTLGAAAEAELDARLRRGESIDEIAASMAAQSGPIGLVPDEAASSTVAVLEHPVPPVALLRAVYLADCELRRLDKPIQGATSEDLEAWREAVDRGAEHVEDAPAESLHQNCKRCGSSRGVVRSYEPLGEGHRMLPTRRTVACEPCWQNYEANKERQRVFR